MKAPDPFFGERAPGMAGPSGVFSTPASSPTKQLRVDADADDEDTGVDTSALLVKMKETVEDMKRRKSALPEDLVGVGLVGDGKGERRMSLVERMSLSPKKREMEWGKAACEIQGDRGGRGRGRGRRRDDRCRKHRYGRP